MEQKEQDQSIKGISKKEPNISVFDFGEIELPVASERSYEDFVAYGDDNLFPIALINSWLQSPIHNAIATGIVQMITGDSITFDKKVLDVEAFARRVNKKGETLDDLINKTAFDLYLHGYFGWVIIWNAARTKIVELYHTPAEQIRSGKVNKETNEVDDFYISWDWSDYRKKRFKPQRIKAYDPTDRSEAKQMMFVKQYRPNQYYYSTPSYIGGINWILLDNRIGEFHLNNIENGFFPSSIVQFFNGEPPQEEKRRIERNFMDKFTGKRSSKMVFVYNNNQEQKVAFETYEPAGIEKRFRDLMPEVSKNIMIAHRVPSPLLFGIRDSGGLGNNAEELESSSLLMNKMVVIPLQNIILSTLDRIFRTNGWETNITIETLQPGQWLKENSDDADASVDEKFSKNSKVIPKELENKVLNHLREKGEKREDLEEDGFVLVQVDDMLTAEGIKMKLKGDEFTNISSNPEDPSYLDKGLYKIRYEYRGPRDEKNRDFCASVLDMNYIYRKEDIDTMTSNQANPEFGVYSIWDYKGSYGCRHKWHRLVFFRKRNPKGQFMPNEGLENDKTVSRSDAPQEVIPEDRNATTVNKDL